MPDPRLNHDFDDLVGEKYIRKNFMNVFWSEPTAVSPFSSGIGSSSSTNQGIISEKIKSALVGFNNFWELEHVLIQFWIPMRTETGCLQLVTSDQPFALSSLDNRLLKYRKHCLEYKFSVDDDHHIHEEEEVEHLGIPSRVFRQKWHETIPDVRYYTSKEYPQRNFALICDIGASFAFPVFDTSFHGCVGVLEFVTTTDTHFRVLSALCNTFFMDALEHVDLGSSVCDCLYNLYTLFGIRRLKVNAIHQGLKVVCTTHNLRLALMWVPCYYQHVFHLKTSHSYVPHDNTLLMQFLDYSSWNDLRNGQEVVGRAYLSRKPCFCRDVTQFSFTQYSLLPGARHFGLTSCFAICLQSIYSLKNDFVLEFFLNPENTYEEEPTTFLCSLLETMKQHLPMLRLASGQQLGKELSIEFIKIPMNQELTSSPCHSPRSPSVYEVLDNGKETMQPPSSNHQQQITEAEVDINKQRNVVNVEQNNTPVSCSDEARMVQEPASFQCQNSRSSSGTGALNNGQETMQPHSSNQQQIAEVVDINNQRNVVNAKQNNTPIFCSDEAITYEKLEIHFGKKLEDVAQIFGVSRSTFKRILRDNGIPRWPRSKRNKMNDSPSGQDPSCSDLTADKPVASLVTTPPEVRKITIKATCGDDMLKFQLPFSSRMVDLEEEVSKRRKLDVGTYKIKYTDGDGDQILIACEKDLQDCMSASNSLGMNAIKMLIEPIT